MITGWTEAMQKMAVGDKREVHIPSELGYGDGGDMLIFRMGMLLFRMGMLDIIGARYGSTSAT